MCIGMSRKLPFDYSSSRSCRVKQNRRAACWDQLRRLIVLWLTLYERAISVSTSPALRRAMASRRRCAVSLGLRATLGALQATFGAQIALLAYLYDVDLEGNLAAILPPEKE
jgi:hypothetical protein